MKQTCMLFLVTVCLALPGGSMGSTKPSELSLLLVPSSPSIIQVARDMSDLGQTLMMSYDLRASATEPFLHIWNGERWLPVPVETFLNGSFLAGTASQVIVVGEENEQTAFLIERSLAWCPEVLHMKTSNVTELINRLGKVYGLGSKDWEWIAERYALDLENLNRDLPQSDWYGTHSPRDVPVTDPPWRKRKNPQDAQPPSTSLAPIPDER